MTKRAAWFDLISGKRLTEPVTSLADTIDSKPGWRVNGQVVDPAIKIKEDAEPWRPMDGAEVVKLRRFHRRARLTRREE